MIAGPMLLNEVAWQREAVVRHCAAEDGLTSVKFFGGPIDSP